MTDVGTEGFWNCAIVPSSYTWIWNRTTNGLTINVSADWSIQIRRQQGNDLLRIPLVGLLHPERMFSILVPGALWPWAGFAPLIFLTEVNAMRRSTRSSHIRSGQPIEPALGWTYLSRDALARAKSQMDEESMGVRDEIGFLTIHQRYADHFFPGTSVLHTRVRYALFVPWAVRGSGRPDRTGCRACATRT